MHTIADFYADPLIYDILHAPGTPGDVRSLLKMARRFMPITPPLTILEPACGTARYLINLAKKGHKCIGFDQSQSMIDFAVAAAKESRVSEQCRFFTADMRDFDSVGRIPKVNLAFNPINTIRHLETDAAMLEHFACIERILAPGGLYVVGLSLSAYGFETPSEDVWSGKSKGISVTQVAQYIPAPGENGKDRIEKVFSHMTIREGESERHIDSHYALRGYNLRQWRAIIAKARFEIAAEFASDGEFLEASEPGYFFFALRSARAK